MSKQRVMDDLDALLADLQSTTSHISSHADQQPPQSPHYNHHQSSVYCTGEPPVSQHSPAVQSSQHTDSRGSTPPPPLPPPPSQDVLDSLHDDSHLEGYHIQSHAQHPVYEPPQHKKQVVRVSEKSYSSHQYPPATHPADHYPPALHTSSQYPLPPQSSQHYPTSPQAQPGSHKHMSSLTNNLSELDSLLQDLSSAQFVAEVDRRNAMNGTGGSSVSPQPTHTGPAPVSQHRPSSKERTVDSLLTELEHFVPSKAQHVVESNHYEAVNQGGAPAGGQQRISPGQQYPEHNVYSQESQPAASTATRELDDLMASLSEFKVTSPTGGPPSAGLPPAQQQPENPYSMPYKPNRPPQQQQQQQQQQQHGGGGGGMPPAQVAQQGRQQNNLENMLGDLNTDMSRQGITTVPKGHCAACSKPIIGQVITGLGKIWHPEHFVCTHCKEELGTQNFFERDGQPYCERDYHNLFSPRCARCHGPILDKCVTALDRTWHPEHFTCAQCGKMFGDSGFHEKEGQVYCREDYFEMFAPKCGGCHHAIMDNYISALSSQWHPECFVCFECRMPFGAGSFFEFEGMPYCETHYHQHRGSLCAGCQKPITGRCITAMYKKFHPEHFVCAFCLKQLNKGTFKEQNDKPYCHPCFVKIFG